LRDLGLLKFDEPAIRLFNQGMVHGSDGAVMSKSRGNVVDPLDMTRKFGADTLRFYLVSNASADKDFIWSEESIEGTFRFLNKIWNFFKSVKIGKSNEIVESKFNKAVKEVAQHIEKFEYNLALIKVRRLLDCFCEGESKHVLEGFLKLISPFCPHIAEELWHNLGNKAFISLEKWPQADESKIKPELEKQEQQIGQLIEDIKNIIKIVKEKQGREAKKIFIYTLPKELELYKEYKNQIEDRVERQVEIFSVSDKKRYDPQNKAQKAKVGKPAVYIE
jgi:leucyl-tRNA synthetase